MKKTLFAASALVATVACGNTVSLDDRACPCATGWTCCAAENVCLPQGQTCAGNSAAQKGGSSNAPVPSSGPLVLATAQSARCLAAGGGRVYWQNTDGLVVSVSPTGDDLQVGTFQTPTATNPRCGIAVKGDMIWRTSYSLGKVIREGTPDGSHRGEGALIGTLETPSSIAVDDSFVYVTEYAAGRVTKLSFDGAIVQTLASGLARPDKILVDDANVYFLELGATRDAVDGALKAVPKSGGDPVVLAAGLTAAGDLTLAVDQLYFTTRDRVLWVDVVGPLASKKTVTAFAAGRELSGPVATDTEDVFWPDLDGIHSASLASEGATVKLLDRKNVVLAMAVDRDFHTYYTDGESVVVLRR